METSLNEQRTIKDLSVNELKIAAFDTNEQIKSLQAGLDAVYKELVTRKTTPVRPQNAPESTTSAEVVEDTE